MSPSVSPWMTLTRDRPRNYRGTRIVTRAMPPVRSSRSIVRAGIFGLVTAVVALAGCSSGVSVPLPGVGPLMTVQMRGGMCPDAQCDNTVVLERDGRVHDGETPATDLGRVSGNANAALDAAIRATDFAAMKSKPFTGQCPIAFDGQELIFEFSVGGATQRLASCETDIDWGSPLFVAVGVALGEWIPLPLS